MHLALLFAVSRCVFWPIAMSWQMDQQNVVVRGTVIDESSGRAVPGIPVYAFSAALDATTLSDSKGEFIFLTLFPGAYYLSAIKTDCDDDVYASFGYEPPELSAGFEYGVTIYYRERKCG